MSKRDKVLKGIVVSTVFIISLVIVITATSLSTTKPEQGNDIFDSTYVDSTKSDSSKTIVLDTLR